MKRTWSATLALVTACCLAAGGLVFDKISGNVLILIAQFLMYSLTLYGFGSIVVELKNLLKKQ